MLRATGLGGFPLVSLREAREQAFANRKVARWSNTYTTAVEGDLSDADDIVVTVRRSKNNPAGCHRSPNNPHLWSLAPLTPMCAC